MEDIRNTQDTPFCSSVSSGAALLPPLKVYLLTMGCAKNEVDSKHMAQNLLEAGAMLVEDASMAECIIVNTCSFIEAATEESLEAIFELCGLENVVEGHAHVIVAGCMPARYGEELEESLEEVKTFVPCSKEDNIVELVSGLFPHRLNRAYAGELNYEPSAYVKISDGCDRFCSFCTIPFIRGRYHSFSLESIRQEVSRACAAGVREIVLIAQDTGQYGQDFTEPMTLAQLLDALAQEFPTTWFRVMYVQPEGVTDELLHVLQNRANVVSYLDIPFQHANAEILHAMNRKGSGADYMNLIRHIRSSVPGISLRTTLIAGFPGETEEQFEELCDFVEEADLDYVGVFAYSREEGTRAAKLENQVPEDVKIERANTLREIADAISSLRVAARIGTTLDVLVLGQEEDGQLYGRAACQAPDVDGVVYLDCGEVGDIVSVTISHTAMYEMEA